LGLGDGAAADGATAADAIATAAAAALRSAAAAAAAEGVAGAGETAAAAAAAAARATLNEAIYTKQTCYVQSDESEICVYDGTLCFDGLSPVVVVERPVREPERINDFTHSCMDPRFYEPSSLEDGGCAYMNSGMRKSFNASRWPPEPQFDTPMSLRLRRWGAINRNGLLFFKEMSRDDVWGAQPENVYAPSSAVPAAQVDLARGGAGAASGAMGGAPALPPPPPPLSPALLASRDTVVERFEPWEALPGLRMRRRTRVGNLTVDWLDGALWIAGIDGQWFSNPYHWFSKIGALFDAMRANATRSFGEHPSDGFPQFARSGTFGSRSSTVAHPQRGDFGGTSDAIVGPSIDAAPRLAGAGGGGPVGGSDGGGGGGRSGMPEPGRLHNPHNRLQWLVGPQWTLPPMDVVLFVGDGAYPLGSRAELKDWFRSTLDLAVQPHTRYFFNDALRLLSPTRLVCATKAVIPGAKNKLFTGRADAAMFRQYAYQVAGLPARGVLPHPRFPPRMITVLDRKGMNGRGIYNRDLLIERVAATGVPYRLVSTMGSMSFAEQVELMSSTGILIAPHGAALANIMFLPAHAVVIELFPYLMKKNTYRYLANLLDLQYYPLYSWELLPRNLTQFYGVALMNVSREARAIGETCPPPCPHATCD
jgi:hypothetical protein